MQFSSIKVYSSPVSFSFTGAQYFATGGDMRLTSFFPCPLHSDLYLFAGRASVLLSSTCNPVLSRITGGLCPHSSEQNHWRWAPGRDVDYIPLVTIKNKKK